MAYGGNLSTHICVHNRMNNESDRACRTCGETLPADAFYLYRVTAKGKRYEMRRLDCKACWSVRRMANAPESAKRKEARTGLRECSACHMSKPLADFPKYENTNPKTGERYSGRRGKCRPCERDETNTWARQNSEKANGWKRKNPERVRAIKHKGKHTRRARLLAVPTYTVAPKDLRRLYSSPCYHCGATGNIHADHVIPLTRGGSHGIGNLAPLCATCNVRKHTALYTEWKYRHAV